MKTIFKDGDKVFDARYGWGDVERADNRCDLPYPVLVNFKKGHSSYTLEGKAFTLDLIPTLSLTEYSLEGFSQERPEVLPNKGDIVWVRINENSDWECQHFMSKDKEFYKTTKGNPWEEHKGLYYRLMCTTNPYQPKKD
jgi:hypothetical protein